MPGAPDVVHAVRATLWTHGYRPLPVQNAKRGDKTSGKAPLGKQWGVGARKDPPECLQWPPVAHALNTGILCDGLRAIDLDIDDPGLAGQLRVLALTMFGATIVRTRENSPRCLLVYRAAEGEPTKVAITGAAHSDSHSCKVEVLGKGQQFVAYGGHWSGSELQWPDGGPADRLLAFLPAVSEAKIHAFLNAAGALIDAQPLTGLGSPAKPKKPLARKGNGHDPEGPPTAALGDIAAALALIPNAGPPDWESWNNVGLAIYAATEGGEAGWGLWRNWSAKNPADDADATLARWEHYATSPPDRTGAGKLFALAGAASPGWRRPSTIGARKNGTVARQEQPELPPIAPAVEPPADGPPPEWIADEVPEEPADTGPEPHPDDPGPEIEGSANITEQLVMRTFGAVQHNELRFNHSSNAWLVWDGHFWRLEERQIVLSWIMNLSKQLAETIIGRGAEAKRRTVERVTFSSNVERGVRAMPPIATAQKDWDANPWLLGTPKGIVDLKTGELRDGTREDMISRTTSVTPSIMPECPTWDAFIEFVTHGDDRMIRFLHRYFGYCLTGITKEEVFLFLYGPGGAGKGTMVETVAYIMGDYAGTVPMEMFAGRQLLSAEYYRASFAGMRLMTAAESERDAMWSEAFIKETTGGDTLSARHPAGKPFRFKPTHKLAMQANHMPKLGGRSTGMARRLLLFPATRKPETPDTTLKAKLLAEAPGILRRMIEGCLAWQKLGLAPPDSMKVAANDYLDDQDNFAKWVAECCNLDANKSEKPASLLLSFNAWAKANNEAGMSGNALAEAIDHSDLPIKRLRTNGVRVVKGIEIKAQNISDIPPSSRWGLD